MLCDVWRCRNRTRGRQAMDIRDDEISPNHLDTSSSDITNADELSNQVERHHGCTSSNQASALRVLRAIVSPPRPALLPARRVPVHEPRAFPAGSTQPTLP